MKKIIIIVEDKQEEQDFALAAIKSHFGIRKEDAGLEGLASEGFAGFQVFPDVDIMITSNPDGAKFAIKLATSTGNMSNVIILTDLMMPGAPRKSEQANGISVLLMALKNGIPVVICSDTDHHEVMFMKELAETLATLHPAKKIPVILDKKDWGRALEEGLKLGAG